MLRHQHPLGSRQPGTRYWVSTLAWMTNLRASADIPCPFRPPIHPVEAGAGPFLTGVKCSRHSPSSRLASCSRAEARSLGQKTGRVGGVAQAFPPSPTAFAKAMAVMRLRRARRSSRGTGVRAKEGRPAWRGGASPPRKRAARRAGRARLKPCATTRSVAWPPCSGSHVFSGAGRLDAPKGEPIPARTRSDDAARLTRPHCAPDNHIVVSREDP